jgi:hypothetical protein
MRWIALLLVAACSKEAAKAPPKPEAQKPVKQLAEPPRPAELSHVTLKALGMYCEEECPLKVRYALADIPAVYELGFDVANEAIFISYDKALGAPKEVTKPMLAAIKGAGFDPWLSKDEWPADAKAQVVLR